MIQWEVHFHGAFPVSIEDVDVTEYVVKTKGMPYFWEEDNDLRRLHRVSSWNTPAVSCRTCLKNGMVLHTFRSKIWRILCSSRTSHWSSTGHESLFSGVHFDFLHGGQERPLAGARESTYNISTSSTNWLQNADSFISLALPPQLEYFYDQLRAVFISTLSTYVLRCTPIQFST